MESQNNTTLLEHAIPGSRAEDILDALQHHKSRLIIQEVVKEYVGSTAFATTIEDIQLKALEADPARLKLKEWVQGIIKEVLHDEGLKKRNFIWPIVISSISAVGTVAAVIVALMALNQP